jgi:hypothetical protein
MVCQPTAAAASLNCISLPCFAPASLDKAREIFVTTVDNLFRLLIVLWLFVMLRGLTGALLPADTLRASSVVAACGTRSKIPTRRDVLPPCRSALSATSHKKNNIEAPSNREADKHKLAQRQAARQFDCL